MPDRGNITGLCDLVGCLISTPPCHDDEKAMIVLRRPGPMQISEADTYIFRMVRQACAVRARFRLGEPTGRAWRVGLGEQVHLGGSELDVECGSGVGQCS